MSCQEIQASITRGALRKCEEKFQEETRRQKATVDKSQRLLIKKQFPEKQLADIVESIAGLVTRLGGLKVT